MIAVFWSFWPVIVDLIKYILKDDDYSFGLLIPFIVGYIVYLKWPKIREIGWQPSWTGLLIIALGYFLYIIGELLTSFYIPSFSLVIVITGLLFLVGGLRLVKLMSFPLLLLILMIPSNTWFIRKISLQLQLISSMIAAWFLRAIGVPVLREGNVLDLGIRKLEVVAACSGLRYILSLLTLVAIFCYFSQRRFWKILILIVSIIPAAIIANALRVSGMGLIPALQEKGFWHNFSGWIIFIVCFGFLVLLNWLLDYFWPNIREPEVPKQPPRPPVVTTNNSGKTLSYYLIAALVLVILLGPLPFKIARVPAVPLLQSFDQFPLKIGPWQGKRNYIDEETIKVLGTADYFDATFIGPEKIPVSLWVAYYGNMKKRGGLLHSPLVCMTGGGWVPDQSREVEILSGKPVNLLVMKQGDQKIAVYYWYLQRGRWLPNEYYNKFYLGMDSLLQQRADGALIRLTTPVKHDVESARNRLSACAQMVVPILQQFIPH